MYRAPEGRPRSVPPIAFNAPSAPISNRDAAVADYIAGVPVAEIRRKYRMDHGALSDDLEARGVPLRRGRYNKAVTATEPAPAPVDQPAVPRPVRADGEAKNKYAQRVFAWKRATDPAFDAQWRAKMSAGMARSIARRAANERRKQRRIEAAAQATAPRPWWRRLFAWLGL